MPQVTASVLPTASSQAPMAKAEPENTDTVPNKENAFKSTGTKTTRVRLTVRVRVWFSPMLVSKASKSQTQIGVWVKNC